MASTKTSKYPPAKPHEIAKLIETVNGRFHMGSSAEPKPKK